MEEENEFKNWRDRCGFVDRDSAADRLRISPYEATIYETVQEPILRSEKDKIVKLGALVIEQARQGGEN